MKQGLSQPITASLPSQLVSWTKKNMDLKQNDHNYLKIHQKGKVSVFWKIQPKCCSIGTKPVTIGGKRALKNELKVGNPPLKMKNI